MVRKFGGHPELIATLAGALLLFTLACGAEPTPTGLTAVPAAVQPPPAMASERLPTPEKAADTAAPSAQREQPAEAPTNASPATSTTGDSRVATQDVGDTGIRVSGQGQASGSPDIAILTMGVESFAESVAEARGAAAAAMDDVVSALREAGVEDPDIHTRRFDISPRYTEREVTKCPEQAAAMMPAAPGTEPAPMTSQAEAECYKVRERTISGYRVSNGLSVRVRNLESVSELIDQVIAAGGDLIRFQGVDFTIEDTSELEEQARTAAVADMKEKAGQLASFSGVELGQLQFLQEVGDPYAYRPKFTGAFAMPASADMATPILPGEQTVTVTVEGVFAIE